ncbi:MAG TPA: S46 family peptidase [Terracidiphilus sp.]
MSSRNLRRAIVLLAVFTLAAIGESRAEEGLWTFDNPPVKLLQEKYGFTPTRAWLDHLRLSSVRLNDGGSGSFVSPDGLLLTNHHVARGQLQKNSTAEHDYLRDGFYAETPEKEMKSPDLEVNVLVGMENVTTRVQGAAKGIPDQAKALTARESEIAAIAKESKDKTGLRSDVVSLYQGGEYWLYTYKAYTDVRLVFAPEQQAAFYGGDPDNFTYPRYDLDMALFRVYESGKPLHTDNYLKWSAKGADPGELIFISGHPGSTQRQDTMAELNADRELIEPNVIEYLKRRIAACLAFAEKGQEQARLVGSTIFGLQNSLKVYEGRSEALADKAIIAKKQAEEDDFKQKVAANAEWQKEFGGAWDTIAATEKKASPRTKAMIFRRTDSRLFSMARQIVQYVAEIKKPDGERLPGYHDAQLETTKFQLLSPAKIEPVTEKLYMSFALNLAEEKLGKDDEYLKTLTQGQDVDSFVNAAVDGTKLYDVNFRKSLIEGGQAAVDASADPMIVAARRTDPLAREYYRWQQTEVISVLTEAGEKLGKARFLVYGKNMYPDATFTLRLSYGTVKGYPYNGTIAPPFTTFYGLYDRAAGFENHPPFDLTPKETANRDKLDLSTPFDFVSTGDIIGGNSGSPVVNREGELVGLIFDGNIESLAGDFVYDGTKNRAVAVHSAGMMEGLRKLYGADALADELLGKK